MVSNTYKQSLNKVWPSHTQARQYSVCAVDLLISSVFVEQGIVQSSDFRRGRRSEFLVEQIHHRLVLLSDCGKIS